MKISIEIELGLVQTYRDFVKWLKKQICKKRGHIWVEYKEIDSFFFHPMNEYLNSINKVGKISHECKRCGEYKRLPYVEDKPLKIKRYSKSSVKKTKKAND